MSEWKAINVNLFLLQPLIPFMSRFSPWLILIVAAIFFPNLSALESNNLIPESLGKWYKPENKRQVWLHTMFAMRRELQAVEEYSEQGNSAAVKRWASKLVKNYRSLTEMVPEWIDQVESDTADDFERAVKRQNMAEIQTLARKLGRSCKGCHIDFQLLARLRYRTAEFQHLEIEDEGENRKFRDFKKELIRTVNRIKISATDGYWETALQAVNTLNSKLQNYGKSCITCHKGNEPRERILGQATSKGLENLENAVISKDLKLTGRSLGSTAVDVCARCHGVHRSLSEIRGELFTAD